MLDQFKLTLIAGDDDLKHEHTGRTFGEAAAALIADMQSCYGDLFPSIFKALSQVWGGGEVREFDFSGPEDQFTLTCEIRAGSGEWEKPLQVTSERESAAFISPAEKAIGWLDLIKQNYPEMVSLIEGLTELKSLIAAERRTN